VYQFVEETVSELNFPVVQATAGSGTKHWRQSLFTSCTP